jgi:predicted ATPase
MHLLSLTIHAERFPDTQRYPFGLPLFRNTRALAFDRPITLFVGENGSGKSTLLRALARSAGIHIWQFEGGARLDPNPWEETLGSHLELGWTQGRVPGSFFASDLFHDFSQLLEEWARADPGQLRYFGGRSLLTQSHGQSLMTYFTHRYQLPGLYLLDEPETALSPRHQVELAELLARCAQRGDAQFVVATHSPLVMSARGARLLSFDGASIAPIEYEETEHYQAYRRFFLARESGSG